MKQSPDNKTKIIYYTDPVCSTCWLLEPYLKRFLLHYDVDLECRMGQLIHTWQGLPRMSEESNGEYLAKLWKEGSARYGIRMSGDIWTKNPVQSTSPSSLAYYAALKQGKDKAFPYLGNIREKIFLQEKNIGEERHLISAAIECGLDLGQFMNDFKSEETLAVFSAHLKDKQRWKVTRFPTLIFVGGNGRRHRATVLSKGGTYQEFYEEWESIMVKLEQPPHSKPTITPLDLLRTEERLSTSSIRIICDFDNDDDVLREMRALKGEGLVVRETHGDIDYWRYNRKFRIGSSFQIKDASIIGAGVCGSHLALALRDAGLETTLYEKCQPHRSKGFGFLLLKNGIDAMDAVGLKNEILKRGNSINFLKCVDKSGRLISKQPLNNFLAISRGDFLEVLQGAYGEDNVRFGKKFSKIVRGTQQRIEAIQFDDGTQTESDLFVATDGIHSPLRGELFKEARLQALGEREIVALVSMGDIGLQQDEFVKLMDAEAGKFMGLIPLGDGSYIWFIQYNHHESPIVGDSPADIRRYVEATVADYPTPFKELVAKTNFEEVFVWVSKRMDLLPKFNAGNLVLAGDAAHPLLPLTSQGANSALEDAAQLASLLSLQRQGEPLEEVLQRYYEKRKQSILHYIEEGDKMMKEFLELREHQTFKLPYLI